MHITRRSFAKKSSFSAVALSILGTGVALADGESSKKKNTTKVPVTAHMTRVTKTKYRKVRSIDGSNEHWQVEVPAKTTLSDENGGDEPPPPKPAAPEGFPVDIGWLEDVNDINEVLLNTAPGVDGTDTSVYDPPADTHPTGENSGTNDGEGAPPAGYVWTAHVRTKIDKVQVSYTMNYEFGEEEEEE